MLRTLYIILFSVFLFNFYACGDTGAQKEASVTDNSEGEDPISTAIKVTDAQFEGEKMQLGSLGEHNFATVVTVTGMIDIPPQNKAVITAFSGGYIKHTPLLIGNSVKKGDFLLSLENPEFIQMQQEYLEAVEQLTYLKSEYERQETLLAEQITSQKNFLKAESDYKRNRAVYNGLRKKLQMLNISPENVEKGILTPAATVYAPISGNITQVNVSIGQYVSPSEIIMEIVNTDHIHVELSVFEKDVLRIEKGQEIRFRIPEVSKDYFKADVYLVGTSIDPQSRTVQVHGHLHDDENYNFAMGMFVEADIITEDKMLTSLPDEAVIELEDKYYVLVLDQEGNGTKTFHAKEVKIGARYAGHTAIVDPGEISASDQLLLNGGFHLLGESVGHDH
ncbi:MAG TPA: efflux RND transporter periplasmic adaptor subunit [Arenibacter sp.]|nr:efflux RND transporter periplasmic adaptor subunit [Arenibacter sp.]